MGWPLATAGLNSAGVKVRDSALLLSSDRDAILETFVLRTVRHINLQLGRNFKDIIDLKYTLCSTVLYSGLASQTTPVKCGRKLD